MPGPLVSDSRQGRRCPSPQQRPQRRTRRSSSRVVVPATGRAGGGAMAPSRRRIPTAALLPAGGASQPRPPRLLQSRPASLPQPCPERPPWPATGAPTGRARKGRRVPHLEPRTADEPRACGRGARARRRTSRPWPGSPRVAAARRRTSRAMADLAHAAATGRRTSWTRLALSVSGGGDLTRVEGRPWPRRRHGRGAAVSRRRGAPRAGGLGGTGELGCDAGRRLP